MGLLTYVREKYSYLDKLDDGDCKKCIGNSVKLLNEAHFNGVSKETKLALTELALGEVAKAIGRHLSSTGSDGGECLTSQECIQSNVFLVWTLVMIMIWASAKNGHEDLTDIRYYTDLPSRERVVYNQN